MNRVSFRERIFLVVAAAVLPLAIMSAVALYAGYQNQQEQAERSGLDLARAVAVAVDGELRRVISVLQVLDDALRWRTRTLPVFHIRSAPGDPRTGAPSCSCDADGNAVLTEVPYGERWPGGRRRREGPQERVRAPGRSSAISRRARTDALRSLCVSR
jgi:hypothetical protein